jgi:serine/threonine-protein kinase
MFPASPARAGLATRAGVSAPPVVIGLMVASRRTTFAPDLPTFFFWLVVPYLLVTLMAYVCARVVHTLRKEVTEARELGSYQLIERLGQGGMGEVWTAKHRLLARPAAIKLIRTAGGGVTTEDAARRFEQEAQVTANLTSPHTVQLYDFGVADDGSFYYVMELLQGMDLESLVRRHGPVPPERAIYLLRQVCHSLAEAHAGGMVHRDIKPANLFVCRYGGEDDFVKVLDFGIAKAKGDVLETGALITREPLLRGTPAYISPEQVVGDAAIDGRADIYATGCVAYFLLTGELVFSGETPMQIVLHHAQTSPVPPSQRSELPIPAALDLLVTECLAKNPADRPQSAQELSRRLLAIDGADDWTQERARAWWDTHRPA